MKQYKYMINGNPYNVVVKSTSDEIAEVEVNGTAYTVEMEKKPAKPLTTPFKKPAQAGEAQPKVGAPVVKRPASTKLHALKSPLPGIVLDITCSVGDTVKKGQKLLILEAMKMENNIIADTDGVIKEIKVHKGDAVLEGADLIMIG
ncbi:MAG TPA: acetyl-CoA carboxylase biotin carboxyl carrier protein subunit [Bacteroidales bacterium]|jgi:biotin carboxyl carrier protein|nr:acetyl-CoA carboxylase biotin carboxyl carrier protein subunit [Bacteroidales bacterium]